MKTNFAGGPFFFVEQASERPLILRDLSIDFQGADSYHATGKGQVFVENVVGGPFHFHQQAVWARQLNQESQGTHLRNDGGQLWILGLKTERGGTLIETTEHGKTEVIGGLCYTTTAGKLAPMFVSVNSSLSVTLGERCYNGDPYVTIVEETQGGVTRTLPAADPAYGGRLVLYSGRCIAKPVQAQGGRRRHDNRHPMHPDAHATGQRSIHGCLGGQLPAIPRRYAGFQHHRP